MVDAHTHIWMLDPVAYPWQPTLSHVPLPTEPATMEQLLGEMDRAGIEWAVLVQPSVYGWNNSYLCDAIASFPDRLSGVCLVDPNDPDAPSHLRRWFSDGCRGFRFNLINQDEVGWLLESRLEPLWAEGARLGATLSLQTLPRHATVIGELAGRHPELTIVIDYLGPDAFHDDAGVQAVRDLGTHPGAWYKLLALGLDSREEWPHRDLWPLYRAAVESFGPERLVYGTNFPHVYHRSTYAEGVRWLDELPFVDESARGVISDTSPRRLWRLPGAG